MIKSLDGEGDERSFELSFASETPYNRRFFGNEILDCKDGAADLTRLNSIGVLLYNHNRDEVMGKIKSAWSEDNRLKAIVAFDTDVYSEEIYQKVKSGTLKGVSVGYYVNAWESVPEGHSSADGRFTGPCEVARSWEPFEISIVSVPADPTVGVARDYGDGKTPRLRDLYRLQLEILKLKYIMQK